MLGARLRTASLGVLSALLCACGEAPRPSLPAGPTYDADGALRVPFARPGRLPNLIVIVIDTLRADVLDPHSGAPAPMPWLAGLSHRGASATQACASAPWTIPSLASLLTGESPSVHDCRGEDGRPVLAPGRTTFAEALARGHGYETAAFAGAAFPGGSSPSLFAGFTNVTPGFMLQGLEPQLAPWVRRRDPARPFFLLLHTYEAHHPYGAANHPFPARTNSARPEGDDPIEALGASPEPKDLAALTLTSLEAGMWLRSRHPTLYAPGVTRYFWNGYRAAPDLTLARQLHRAYDEGAAWVDGLLRRAHERLEAWGLLENTLLVVTADHGEAFGEHGVLMHGRDCHDELVRIPLVLSGIKPFEGGARLEASIGLLDLLPTFMDLAGLPALDGIEGRSFLPLATVPGPGHPVLSEEWATLAKTGGDDDLFLSAVRSTRWKVILTRDLVSGRVTEKAYDLVQDPGEQADLAGGPGGVEALALDAPFRTALATARARLRDFRPSR